MSVKYHEGKFPPSSADLDLQSLLPLLGPAYTSLAGYDGLLRGIPNANVLLSPLSSQEAVLSSRIEGTRATLGEVLEYEAGEKPKSKEKFDDIQEIINYRHAMITAQKQLGELPLCQRILRNSHRILMRGVRGQNKSPGEYKKTPNWIGAGDIDTAIFLPPSPEKVPALMGEWEKFIHAKFPECLTQLALLHVEFEAIHPFYDGNGRIGRMIIPLFMYYLKIISAPTFYISEFFERNREEYNERLNAVSRKNDWTGWCAFFLKAVDEQARKNCRKAEEIQELREDLSRRVAAITHSHYSVHVIDFIFTTPIFQTPSFTSGITAQEATARGLLRQIEKHGVVKIIRKGSGRRPTRYVFPKLLNIVEGRDVF